MTAQQESGLAAREDEPLEVWIDQDLCTGDGICAQYAPEVFELDIDGLAYVKSGDDELLQAPARPRVSRCRCSGTSRTRPRSAPASASTSAG
ncbi:4Fe-4S single cluster domain-containing protein [Streptomyces sp. SolWspMP-sol7th]|nr:4Fe-4S single cluster domain-containing protein [Streptomyces sp. SolWspMP-sol7th]